MVEIVKDWVWSFVKRDPGFSSKGRRRVEYLTKTEVEAFFRAIPPGAIADRLLFDLMYRHGLRRSEASLLRVRDVAEGRIWIERRKNGVSGQYPLHPVSRGLLAKHLKVLSSDSEWLFPSPHDAERPISTGTIYHRFRGYAARAGLPIEKRHPHLARHAAAVHLMDAGWDVADVQDWLGHKSIKNTMVYAKITNKRREENYARLLKSTSLAKTNFNK